jgi:hypothetical protein
MVFGYSYLLYSCHKCFHGGAVSVSNLNDASTRYAAVDNSTDPSRVEALAANPDVLLHVTRLDLGRLPEHVKASLYTEADAFNAPGLRTSGNIYAAGATIFDLSQLQASGDIHAYTASSLNAPELQTSGNILAGNATSFDAPQLQASGQIIAVPNGKKS